MAHLLAQQFVHPFQGRTATQARIAEQVRYQFFQRNIDVTLRLFQRRQ